MRLLKIKPERPKPKLEKTIAADFKKAAYAKWGQYDLDTDKGMLMIVKLSTLAMYGEAGWEDHMILIRKSVLDDDKPRTVFIEWKRPGGKSSDVQRRRQAEHKAMGFAVRVCDTVEQGMDFLLECMIT